MNRRSFVRAASGMGASLALGGIFWDQALSAPAQPGASPYGPLLPPDANGLRLPEGFRSRVVARSGQAVADTGHTWHVFPDGAACFATDDGGWIYVSNSENPFPIDLPFAPAATGGVGAIRFDVDGAVVDAYSILDGSSCNCAGGVTPWGTWLSCEEWEITPSLALAPYEAGRVWECWPDGSRRAAVRPGLGRWKHEMVAIDPVNERAYLTEDLPDGRFYRFTPEPGTWGSDDTFRQGTIEAAAVGRDGATTWVAVSDPSGNAGPVRDLVPRATGFDGGEGVVYDSGRVYFTTKGDDVVWVHDIAADTITRLYAADDFASPVLNGVDNIIASAAHDLYIAEDGGNLQVNMITPELTVAPIVRMTGPQHGFALAGLPTESEVTGLALSPDGNRLYFSSERGDLLGITYEVIGPFRGGTLATGSGQPTTTTTAPATTGTTTPPTIPSTPSDQVLPATGGPGANLGVAAGTLAVVGGALWKLRERVRPTRPSS